MRALLACLLLSPALVAQGAGRVAGPTADLHPPRLGSDPLAQIHLVPAGSWDGLLLTASRPTPPAHHRLGEATVEVWDLAVIETPRQEAQRQFLSSLHTWLNRAWAAPPASHGAAELSEFMNSDPSQPQQLSLSRVDSLQRRYNRMPPGGLPPR